MGFICSFSDQRNYLIACDGREYMFDFSQQFGPLFLNKDESERKKQPPIRVLEAVTYWFQQGKQIDDKGYCLYRWPGIAGNKISLAGHSILFAGTKSGLPPKAVKDEM